MPTYGIQYLGVYIPQTQDDIVVKGYIYEEIRRYNQNIPPDKYFTLLQQLRETIDNSEYGIKTRYIEVNENWIRVQFEQRGSPLITLGTVVKIIAVAISMAIVGWTASLALHEIYKIVSVLGSETASMIVAILLLVVCLNFISSIFKPLGVK